MKKTSLILLMVAALALSGCKTAKNGRIVSPDSISQGTAEENAPSLPSMTPWWVE